MTNTNTTTTSASASATSARFEVVHTSPDKGEQVLATRWTLAGAVAAADKSGASRRANTEVRFAGVTLMHSAPGRGLVPTAFRPAAL